MVCTGQDIPARGLSGANRQQPVRPVAWAGHLPVRADRCLWWCRGPIRKRRAADRARP